MIINPKRALDEGWITFPDERYPFQKDQLQPNGVDLRLMNASKLPIHKPFKLLLDGSVRLDHWIPEQGYCKGCTTFVFERGIPYLVDFWEWIKIPEGIAAEIIARSTLNMNGIWARSTLYDSGFSNHGGMALYPWVPFEAHVGVRIAQIVFHTADSNHLYDGRNQHTRFKVGPGS